MAKKVMFVVGAIDFQYNDETYSEPEGDSTKPVTVYRTRASANKAVIELSLTALGEWDLMSFGYGADEVFQDPDVALDVFKEVGYEGDLDDLGGMSEDYVKEMTDDQKRRLLGSLNVQFYRVHEVEVSDE